jgi:hypothetical protein
MPLKANRKDGADLFTADGAIPAYTIAQRGTDYNGAAEQAKAASAATQILLGAVQNSADVADKGQVRIPEIGENAKVLYGGTVDLYDELTTDGNGKAIKASTTNYTIGRAGGHYTSGQIGVYKHNPGVAK